MKLDEIKQAVSNGKTVHWANELYTVVKWTNGYHILCSSNDHAIGLTHRDGITMNGREEQFYIAP